MADQPEVGSIIWRDLTVDDADGVRDFYAEVVGWQVEECPMGDYADYAMAPPGGDAVSGVCHARGGNTGLPAQWLMYVTVADLDASLAAVAARGGAVVREPRPLSGGRFAVIQEAAGAFMALWQAA